MAKIYQEAERFINEQFYQFTADGDPAVNIEEEVNKKLLKDSEDKDPEYYKHRMGNVHVSYLYGCLRGVLHSVVGSPTTAVVEPRQLGVFKAGNLFEEFIVDALGDKVLNRQTEYLYKHKNITVIGRDDGLLFSNGKYSILEAKSVHSKSFWYKKQEGVLVAWNNQMQLQTYLWFRRTLPNLFLISSEDGEPYEIYTNLSEEELLKAKPGFKVVEKLEKPDWSELKGVFSYISKDDCQVISAPVKFNQNIIDEVILPILDTVSEAYAEVRSLAELRNGYPIDSQDFKLAQEALNKKINELLPAPDFVVWNEKTKLFNLNWLCKYNNYADHCYGNGWLLDAQREVKERNLKKKKEALTDTFNSINV